MPSVHHLWPLFVLCHSMILSASGLRCYTDVGATKSNSMECGLNTGCVKIYIDTEEMMLRRQVEYGYGYGFPPPEGVPPLPEKYTGNPVLRRGCFVLAVPDRCYTANNGLSYCWCSQKDLCNGSNFSIASFVLLLFNVILIRTLL